MTTTLTPSEAIEVLRIGIGAIALWILYFHFWSDYKLDAFRQRLFDLRAALFDFALSSGLSFDDPAYGKLRERINRLIRWADQFTGVHFLLLLIALPKDAPVPKPHREWLEALETINDPETRKRLREFENRLAAIMVRRVFFTPFGVPFLVILTFCFIIKRLLTVTWDEFRRRFGALFVAGGTEEAFEHLSANVPGLERLEAQTEIEDAFAQPQVA